MSDNQAAFVSKILVPKRRPGTLRRVHLLDKLRGGPAGGLTIIQAPVGFGKTTLLVDLSHEAGASMCWLSLDEWDRDVKTFLQYLRLAVFRRVQSSDPRADKRWTRREPRIVLAEIAGELSRQGGDKWVILDDFHFVDGSEQVVGLVDYFAQRLPENCRLFLASRTRPPLPSLMRLRVQGTILQLGASDLAFDAGEIKQYFSLARDEAISDDQAADVFRLTQGWPAAVALIRTPGEIPEHGLAPLDLADYLTSEVLRRLPEGIRRFLLWTSVLDTLKAEGCEAILEEEDASRILEMLDAENVPIIRVQGPTTEYRLHPLFRDFLRRQLAVDDRELYRNLHCKAANWQASAGRPSEAIWHLAQAEEWDKAAEVIEREAPNAYRAGRWQTITSWLELLPAADRRGRVRLALWEARILVRLGLASEALRVLVDAEHADFDEVTRAECETIRAAALRVKGDVASALRSAQVAVDLAARGNAPVETMAEARKQLGQALFAEGAFSEAAHELRAVLEIYQQRGNVEEAAFVNGCLGSTLGASGKLAESAMHLEQARQHYRKVGNTKELCWVLNNLGVIYFQMGQSVLARELLLESVSNAREAGHERAEAYAVVSLADIARKFGELTIATQRYEEALRVCADLGEMTLSTLALTGLALVCQQLGNPDRAEALVRQALASAEERGSVYEEALARVALGRVSRRAGKFEDAIHSLTAAAALFERVGAKKEHAESLFYLADASLALRQARALSKMTLERLASLAKEVGHDEYLVEAVRDAPRAAEYAASRRIGGTYYRDLLRRSVSSTTEPGDPAERVTTFPVVHVRALGDLEVRLNERTLLNFEWESEKSKELFLFLRSHKRPLARDEIIANLWPDAGGRRAGSAFHSTLYRVRRALYSECVVESGGLYSLNPSGSFTYDVDDFQALVARTRALTSDRSDYVEALGAAVQLYQGPFAPQLAAEWAGSMRLKLEQAFLEIAGKLGDELLKRGDYAGAARVAEAVLGYDPYSEVACSQLMKACLSLGALDGAVRAYRRYGEVLREELGETPGRPLQHLYAQIRQQLA